MKDFERKASLFSLAIADVLIVNVWENNIGLYNASNLNLLRTVLDAFLDIYSSLKYHFHASWCRCTSHAAIEILQQPSFLSFEIMLD